MTFNSNEFMAKKKFNTFTIGFNLFRDGIKFINLAFKANLLTVIITFILSPLNKNMPKFHHILSSFDR